MNYRQLLLLLSCCYCSLLTKAQTNIIGPANNGDFESGAVNWTTVNGNETNKWRINSNFKCSGNQAAFIGSSSTVNTYNNGSGSVVHLYRDVVFPAGQCDITLSFTYKGVGETNNGTLRDYMRVYLVPTSTNPQAGNALTAASLIGNTGYNLQTNCTSYSISLPTTLAGTTQRLVFSWINNNSGGGDPAALLDNVVLAVQSVTSVPSGCASIVSPSNGNTFSCNSNITLNWSSVTCATGYRLSLGTTNPPSNLINGLLVGNVQSYSLGVLNPNTTYYWQVIPENNNGPAACSSVWSFTTGSNCVIQTNGEIVNTCTGNYYDSGGPTANYTNNENSVSTICPGTPGQYVQLNFSTINLESNNDLLSIFNGRTTTNSLLNTLTGSTMPCSGSTITSTDTSGCLTMQFASNATNNQAGWNASISCVSTPPTPTMMSGSQCSNAVLVNLPYTVRSQTTACYGNDYSNSTPGSCGSLYESGEDRVYALNIPFPVCISVTLSGANTTAIGYQLYSGCPGSASASCMGFNGGSANLTSNYSISTPGVYYLIVDTWSPPINATYDLAISVTGVVPSNDLPCNASVLPLGVNLSGDNSCSSSAGEPAVPSCWTTGAMNTVWYRVVAPATGRLKIRTTLGTNSDTQIALYSGACGSSMTQVASACNQDAVSCGGSSYKNSELSVTGLTPGTTYFIRVDGANSITGRFDIIAIDGATTFPAVAGQDCGAFNPICGTTVSVGNPGYQGFGNNCDFPGGGSNCLSSGERASAWYSVSINASGTFSFDIVPNNWAGAPSTASTDYDFAVWKIAGVGATNCSGIAGGAAPIRCNYSALGVTGLFGTITNTSPAAYPGFGSAYLPQLNVDSGDVYVIVVSNYSNSTSGFSLIFPPSAPIAYNTTPTSVTWSGGVNNLWAPSGNWGGCTKPTCGISATISPAASSQPMLPSTARDTVENLVINAGSSLTLGPGSILNICGNFTNYGSLIADPTSTIAFIGGGIQTISGSLIGSDKFPNLVVNKSTGYVILNNDIDISGSFTTSSSSSVFNSNGKYIKLAGNFNNSSGSATFNNIGVTGTLEFNGTATQNYNPGGSLQLNFVVMNHTGPGVNLLDDMYITGVTGRLTLGAGKLITNSEEVVVYNRDILSVNSGNANSFIQGSLRRFINGLGSYNFPVGNAAKGYQLANVNFTSVTTIDNLEAEFLNYATIPAATNISECNSRYNYPALNNGKWQFAAFNSSMTQISGDGNGQYTMTLYNLAGSYSNNAGSAWTIQKDSTGTGQWVIIGNCLSSTVNQVSRSGMTGFTSFGTAQGGITLPIQLIDFAGRNEGSHNILEWTTASEENNDYFTLFRSSDGKNFEPIARQQGAGNSTSLRNYSYIDLKPLTGSNYYQLYQTDFDGKESHSDVILVKTTIRDFSVVGVRPNPNKGRFSIDFNAESQGTGNVKITDLTGRTVAELPVRMERNSNNFHIDLPGLSAGLYSISVREDATGISSQPIVFVVE